MMSIKWDIGRELDSCGTEVVKTVTELLVTKKVGELTDWLRQASE
jgi:hypothetical protein